MRVGLMFPPRLDPGQVVSVAQSVEDAGFDHLACGEHIFFRGPITNAFVTLAAAAGATSRLRLLSAVTILPMYAPAVAAKLVASMDRVSQGRFDLGVGVGGEFPPEFEAAGVPIESRGRRTDECLVLMRKLFDGGEVDFEGEFATIAGLAMEPGPVQRPGPPVWVGGRKRRSIRRAAEHGDVWLPYLVTPEQVAQGRLELETLCANRDRVRIALFAWGALSEDGSAQQGALETLAGLYKQDFSARTDYLLTGNADQIVTRLHEFAAAGVEELVFAPACPLDRFDEMVEQFAETVLPAVQQIGPA